MCASTARASEDNRIIYLPVNKASFINFLRYEFQCPDGDIRVTRNSNTGRYLYSRVRYSDLPPAHPSGAHVRLIMPAHELDQSHYRFISFSSDDIVRINDYIEAVAYLDFRMMVQVGAHELHVDKKTVINVFSEMVLGEEKYEQLKKYEYRRRLKVKNFLRNAVESLE